MEVYYQYTGNHKFRYRYWAIGFKHDTTIDWGGGGGYARQKLSMLTYL